MDNNIEKIIKEKKSILNEELEQVSGGEGGKKKKYRVDGYTKQGRHILFDFDNYDCAMDLCKALLLSLDCITEVYV